MFKKLLPVVLTGAIIFMLAHSANAASMIFSATLNAYPASYSGNCPSIISFKGKITLVADSTVSFKGPVDVKYRFKRNDGANDSIIKIVKFTRPGSTEVSTTWTLSAPALTPYSGWEAIEIISPQHVESNKANFVIRCSAAPTSTTKPYTSSSNGIKKPGKNSSNNGQATADIDGDLRDLQNNTSKREIVPELKGWSFTVSGTTNPK